MSARRSFLDWLRGRPDPDGSEWKAGAHQEGGAPVPEPVRPTRMVVSGGSLPAWPVKEAPSRFTLDPRLRLWRDTSAVLVIFALVIAFSDWLPRPEQSVLSETDALTQTSGSPPVASAAPTEILTTPGPTPEPSAAPPPTVRPTARPTPRPTPGPTAASSAMSSPSASAEPPPTESPTASPSASAEPPPTESATASPSASAEPPPTESPSESPTPSPP